MKFIKLICIALLVNLTSFAQNGSDTVKYISSPDYGNKFKRVKIQRAFIPPTDTVFNKFGFAVLNGASYIGNGTSWSLSSGGGGGGSQTLAQVYATQSNNAAMTTSTQLLIGNNTHNVYANNGFQTGGIFLEPTGVTIQASQIGASGSIQVRQSGLSFSFPGGKWFADNVFPNAILTTSDPASYFPIGYNHSLGQFKRFTSWPGSAGEYMVYPGAGIPLSTGTGWGTSITDNSTNWNTAYTDRNKWDGGATGLNASTGRTSLGLGNFATRNLSDNTDVTGFWNFRYGGIGLGTVGQTGLLVYNGGSDQSWDLPGQSGTLALTSDIPAVNTTTVTGIIKGDGSTMSAAVAGTDYVIPSGNVATLTTGRTISGTGDATFTTGSFNGSANVSGAVTVSRINGTSLAGLSTGLLKNTTGTGVPSIATAGTDYVTPGGNVATATALATGRTISGTGDATFTTSAFDGTANVSGAVTVSRINGTSLAGLATGILKNTTTTGVPSIAVAGDFPTLNQNTTGSAATLTTGRTISGTGDATFTTGAFDGSANVSGAVTVTKINGTSLAGLATGILKNTTSTGVPSIAVAGDFPTLNQNTTGSAGSVANALSIGAEFASGGATTYNGSVAKTLALQNNSVTNAHLAQVSTATFKGRTTAGTGNVEDLTATQATALLNVFQASTKGLVPAPSASPSSTKYLSEDGTFSTPSGGSSTSTTDNMFQISSNVLTARKTVLSLTDGATITWDASTGYNATVTLGGNRTLSITNPQAGDFYTIVVKQDGTGFRTLTLPDGSLAKLNLKASDSTTLSGYYRNSAFIFRSDAVDPMFVALTSTYTLTSTTSTQKLFNATTNGAITLQASTLYYFECEFALSSMSATSGNCLFDILGGGTATVTSTAWTTYGVDNTTPTATAAASGLRSVTTASGSNVVAAGTGTGMWCRISGIIRINAGGTIIPSVGLTTAAAAVVAVNSFFKITPIGSGSATNAGPWN